MGMLGGLSQKPERGFGNASKPQLGMWSFPLQNIFQIFAYVQWMVNMFFFAYLPRIYLIMSLELEPQNILKVSGTRTPSTYLYIYTIYIYTYMFDILFLAKFTIIYWWPSPKTFIKCILRLRPWLCQLEVHMTKDRKLEMKRDQYNRELVTVSEKKDGTGVHVLGPHIQVVFHDQAVKI